MRYYLCLVIVIVTVIACETARVARVTEQSYFPNFRNLYDDHDYQGGQANGPADVPFFGNYKTQGRNIGVGNEYYGHRSGIGAQGNVVNHLIRAPFGQANANNVGFGGEDAVPREYERFNHALNNYDYQL